MYKCSNVLPSDTRLKLYYSYVYPHLINLNSIWCDAHRTSNYLFKHIQTLQNKFLRTIYKEEYFYNNVDPQGNKIIHTIDLYKKHDILTLSQINRNECARITHRILHKTINIDFNLDHNTDVHGYNTRNSSNIHLYKKYGFIKKISMFYNELPDSIKKITNHIKFKKLVKNYLINPGVT